MVRLKYRPLAHVEGEELFREEARRRFRAEPWQPPLLSKPVSGLAIGLFALVAVTAAVAFASTFQFTRKEQARGYLTPASGWSQVSAPTSGMVARRLVNPGDAVEVGDVLLEFASVDGIDRSQTVERELLEKVAERRTALESRLSLIDSQYGIDKRLHVAEQRRSERQRARLARELASLKSRLGTARQRLASGQRLLAGGLLAKAEVMTLEDELRARSLALSETRSEMDQVAFVLATAGERLEKLSVARERELTEVAGRLLALAMEEARIRGRGAARVLAPRDGVAVSVRASVGDQLQSGDALLDIVPENSEWRARLYAQSAAMGTVSVGQEVRVYLDAFPYERHGAQIGRVAAIFETTLKSGEADMVGGAGVGPGAPVFRLDVDFPAGFDLAPEWQAALRPGMTLTADLVRDRGTLVDWMLEPLRGAAGRL